MSGREMPPDIEPSPVEPIYAEIGRRIRERRRRLGMTQAQLGDAISLTRASITNIELGRQRLVVHTMYDLAIALRCAPGDLAPKPKRDFLRFVA